MAERQSAFGQRPADQQAAMAVERLALGAKQAHAMARHFIRHPLEPGRKFRRGGHGHVVGDAVAIEPRIARAAAEGVANRDIGDGLAGESRCQRLAREPGAPARERHRAHVGDGGDAGVLEQRYEAVGRQVGVADGQEVAGGWSRHGIGRIPAGCPVLRTAARSDGAPVTVVNVNGNRALAFVVVRRTGIDRRARAGGCQLEDAMGRFAGGVGLAVLLSLLSWPGHARADVMVRIDKSSQRMSVMVNGEHRYTWSVSTGIYGTPSGTFRPQSLARYHRSTLYNNAPMPYSIFYDGNFAIHGTTHVSQLGGPASRGCIRLHPSNAAVLFSLVQQQGLGNTRISIH